MAFCYTNGIFNTSEATRNDYFWLVYSWYMASWYTYNDLLFCCDMTLQYLLQGLIHNVYASDIFDWSLIPILNAWRTSIVHETLSLSICEMIGLISSNKLELCDWRHDWMLVWTCCLDIDLKKASIHWLLIVDEDG